MSSPVHIVKVFSTANSSKSQVCTKQVSKNKIVFLDKICLIVTKIQKVLGNNYKMYFLFKKTNRPILNGISLSIICDCHNTNTRT